jgi:hypothetical protein
MVRVRKMRPLQGINFYANGHRGSAALTMRRPSIRKRWH